MNTQHTPGPWKPLKTFGGVTIILDHEDKSVAYLRGYKHPYKANARLIAAAPELLEALAEMYAESEKAMQSLGIPMLSADWHEKARAAIAKATGDVNG